MGQTYTVETRLKFKNNDPSKFCQIIKKEVLSRHGHGAVFSDLDKADFTTPFGCFAAVCPCAHEYEGETGEYYADFDASYGWEGVMTDIFYKALEGCEDGSKIEVYPDSGVDKMWIENGEVRFE